MAALGSSPRGADVDQKVRLAGESMTAAVAYEAELKFELVMLGIALFGAWYLSIESWTGGTTTATWSAATRQIACLPGLPLVFLVMPVGDLLKLLAAALL
jgi:hypothetical protein